MKTRVGLWIDHRKAVVVHLTDEGEAVGVITSKVERQLRRTGDAPFGAHFEPMQVPADPSRQRVFTAHLNRFYDTVLAYVGDPEAILVLGPGEAKVEFTKRLEAKRRGDRVVGVEAADKLTERQLVARVRRHFAR
jgi:hypothetical protein